MGMPLHPGRTVTVAALLAVGGCAAQTPGPPRTLQQILQDEGAQPGAVPPYLIGPDGTFITNKLTPLPWGDTR